MLIGASMNPLIIIGIAHWLEESFQPKGEKRALDERFLHNGVVGQSRYDDDDPWLPILA